MDLSHLAMYGTLIAVTGPPAAVMVWLTRRRSRRCGRRAAEAWEQIITAAHRRPEARLGQVVAVHQRARTGTKAWVRWHAATSVQDVWFRGVRATTGTWYLAVGFDRYGPHRHEPHLFDVTAVLLTAPATAPREWLLRQDPPRTNPAR